MNKTILLVEDSEDDVFFMKRALKLAGVAHSLEVATDGQAAVDYLEGKELYANRAAHPWPSLVLLDLRLPLLPGLEVLEWIRSKPQFSALPVVVLTSSGQQSDLAKAYRLGANSFLIKPASVNDLSQMAKVTAEYWLCHNQAPDCRLFEDSTPLDK